MKRIDLYVIGLLVLTLLLSACGDNPTPTTTNSATAAPVATTAAVTTTTVTTAAATTLASTTAATTQGAATIANSTTGAIQFPLTVTDSMGTSVTVPKKVERVVCLFIDCIEDLITLGMTPIAMQKGLKDNYLGVYTSLLPDKGASIVGLSGSLIEPSLEDIAQLKPDLVVGGAFVTPLRDGLKNIAPVFVTGAAATTKTKLEGLFDELRSLGKMTDHQAQAELAIKKFQDRAAAYKAKISTPKSVLYVQDYTVQYIPSADSITGEVLSQVGTYPFKLDKVVGNGWAPISLENLLQLDPDVIFVGVTATDATPEVKAVSAKNKQDLSSNAIWKGLKAVTNNQLIEVDINAWSGSGILGITTILDQAATKLYPEVFPKPLP